MFTLEPMAGNINPATISVQLNVLNLDRSTSSQTLTSANGLTVTNTATMWTISAPLSSNKVYTSIITASDANGPPSYTNTFDTPSFTWECEDWDYNSGQYIDNP